MILKGRRDSAFKKGLIEKRMPPDSWSRVGFLKENQSLLEVAQIDKATIKKCGITFDQFRDRLESLVTKSFELENLQHFGEHFLPLVE